MKAESTIGIDPSVDSRDPPRAGPRRTSGLLGLHSRSARAGCPAAAAASAASDSAAAQLPPSGRYMGHGTSPADDCRARQQGRAFSAGSMIAPDMSAGVQELDLGGVRCMVCCSSCAAGL